MAEPMSLPDPNSEKTAIQTGERRRHPRRKPRQLVYIDIGQNNGGFILDVSEGGVAFQGVASLDDGEIVKVRFKLPGTSISIRAEGRFVRSGSSEKGGALKFVNVPPEVQMQLREWIALTGRAESPNGDADVVSLLSGKADNPEEDSPVRKDGTTRFTSILAQAIARSAEQADPASLRTPPRPESLAPRSRSNRPEPLSAEEKAPQTLPPAPRAPTAQPSEVPQRSAEFAASLKAPSLFGLPVNPAVKAANDSVRSVREAVLHEAASERAAKRRQVSNFAAGIVVGCVVLVGAGGGLVATGRLRLIQTPSAPTADASANAQATSNVAAGSADAGSQEPSLNAPATSEPATASATEPAPPPAVAPAAPAAAAPIRSGRSEKINDPSAAPSKALSSQQRNTPVLEAAKPAEPVRQASLANPIQLGMNRPVVQASATQAGAVAAAPSFPAGAGQSLPEVGSNTPASVSQSSAPSVAQETFASPQIEQKPAPKAPRTDTVSQRSKPVFASPDSNGAKPSTVEPAELVLYVEPVYPPAARASKIQGSVDVLATIGKDGVPRELRATNGDPQLAAAAIAAISGWRYRPAILNGQFEESLITITVKFAL